MKKIIIFLAILLVFSISFVFADVVQPHTTITTEIVMSLSATYDGKTIVNNTNYEAGSTHRLLVQAGATDGIITGRTLTTISPQESATRAKVATIIARYKI